MGMKLTTKVTTLIRNNYRPELYETNEVEQIELTIYQEVIWELRWEIEIGRLEMLHEVSYEASPEKRHMGQIIHIPGYLKKISELTL